jgi:hypothetical protein
VQRLPKFILNDLKHWNLTLRLARPSSNLIKSLVFRGGTEVPQGPSEGGTHAQSPKPCLSKLRKLGFFNNLLYSISVSLFLTKVSHKKMCTRISSFCWFPQSWFFSSPLFFIPVFM